MGKIVFITRELTAASPFRKILTEAGYKVVCQSLIEFSAISFSAVPEVDWVFFYSPNCVRFFFEGLNQLNERRYVVPEQFAAMGTGTAKTLKEVGRKATFIGSGPPEKVGEAFGQIASGKRVLFPRATDSRKSIQKFLEGRIRAYDLVVYNNVENPVVVNVKADYLVFTSPKNVCAFAKKNSIGRQQKVVAIGRTTAKALTKRLVTVVHLAEEPSETALAECVLRCG